MVVVTVAGSQVERDVDPPSVVRERLEAFAGEVFVSAMNRPVQVRNGGLYLRGLIEVGARKSLEPLVSRLGGDAEYQSMQQFLADSPWDSGRVVQAVAERVAPAAVLQVRVARSPAAVAATGSRWRPRYTPWATTNSTVRPIVPNEWKAAHASVENE